MASNFSTALVALRSCQNPSRLLTRTMVRIIHASTGSRKNKDKPVAKTRMRRIGLLHCASRSVTTSDRLWGLADLRHSVEPLSGFSASQSYRCRLQLLQHLGSGEAPKSYRELVHTLFLSWTLRLARGDATLTPLRPGWALCACDLPCGLCGMRAALPLHRAWLRPTAWHTAVLPSDTIHATRAWDCLVAAANAAHRRARLPWFPEGRALD